MARQLRSNGFLTNDEREFIRSEIDHGRVIIGDDKRSEPSGQNKNSLKTKRNRIKSKIACEASEDLKRTLDDWTLFGTYLKEIDDIRESEIKRQVVEMVPDLKGFLKNWLSPNDFSSMAWSLIDPDLEYHPRNTDVVNRLYWSEKGVDSDFFGSYDVIPTNDINPISIFQPDKVIEPFRSYLLGLKFDDDKLEEKRKKASEAVNNLYSSIKDSYFSSSRYASIMKSMNKGIVDESTIEAINKLSLVEIYGKLVESYLRFAEEPEYDNVWHYRTGPFETTRSKGRAIKAHVELSYNIPCMIMATESTAYHGCTIYSIYQQLYNYSIQDCVFVIGEYPDGRFELRRIHIPKEKYTEFTQYLKWWSEENSKTEFFLLGVTSSWKVVEHIHGYCKLDTKLNGLIAAMKKILKVMEREGLISKSIEKDRASRIKEEQIKIEGAHFDENIKNGLLKLLNDESYYRITRLGFDVGRFVENRWKKIELKIENQNMV